MPFRSRFGNKVRQEVVNDDGDTVSTFRKSKRVQHNNTSTTAIRATQTPPITINQLPDLLDDTAYEQDTTEDDFHTMQSVSSESSDEDHDDANQWYEIENALPEEDIQERLEAMRLESERDTISVESTKWTQKTVSQPSSDKAWSTRQNWIHIMPQLTEQIISSENKVECICSEPSCNLKGLWRCLECDSDHLSIWCSDHLSASHFSPQQRLHNVEKLIPGELEIFRITKAPWSERIVVPTKDCQSCELRHKQISTEMKFVQSNGVVAFTMIHSECITLVNALSWLGYFPSAPIQCSNYLLSIFTI